MLKINHSADLVRPVLYISMCEFRDIQQRRNILRQAWTWHIFGLCSTEVSDPDVPTIRILRPGVLMARCVIWSPTRGTAELARRPMRPPAVGTQANHAFPNILVE